MHFKRFLIDVDGRRKLLKKNEKLPKHDPRF